MRRLLSVTSITLMLSLVGWARISDRQKAEIVDNEQMIFSSGGVIEVYDSVGDVTVEGWDRPEVELVITRASHRTYTETELPAAVNELEHIVVTTQRPTEDRLVITTVVPGRAGSVHVRPNADISYHIRAPRQTRLVIKHDIGEISVQNIAAKMDITARAGGIALRLPEAEQFRIDARVRVGAVCSQWPSPVLARHAVRPLDLHLRVGIGDITVRAMKPSGDRA